MQDGLERERKTLHTLKNVFKPHGRAVVYVSKKDQEEGLGRIRASIKRTV